MMLALWNGIGSLILRCIIRDSTLTNNGGKTGLTFSSSGLIISTIADNEATAVPYTQAGATIETITTLGTFATPTTNKCRFKEVDATNHPGLYEVQIANARWGVSGARYVVVTISGVSGATQENYLVQLPGVNLDDSTNSATPAISATSFSTVNTTLATIAAYIDTEVAAIKAKTDNLPNDPADASDIAATLATIASYIDTEVATLVTSVGAGLGTICAAIKVKTDLIPATPAAAGDAMALTSGERTTLTDVVLGRSVSTIESTAAEHSLATIILAGLESSISGSTWIIKRTDGTTTHFVKTVTTSASADPVTGVT